MRTFVQKPKPTLAANPSPLVMGRPRLSGPGRHRNPLQRSIANQAGERPPPSHGHELEAEAPASASPCFAHDFSRISLHAGAPAILQPKLQVNTPGDTYEQEADRVAEQVMRMPGPQLQRTGADFGEDSGRRNPQAPPVCLHAQRLEASDIGEMVAPPIVHEVLRSSGQPLEPAARDFMEQRFGHDFGQIRIHTDPDAAKASAALGAEAFTVGHHIAFGRERFLPATAHGKRLVAHELTHAIQQAATSPHIALQPDKTRPAPTPGRSGVVGGLLGWNQSNVQVRVKREVGATQGYDDRFQAIAVARIAKAEPAAVVQDTNQKWHAVEITSDFEAGPNRSAPAAMEASAAEDSPFLAVYGLPSLTGLESSRQRVAELKAKLAELDARKPRSEDERNAVEKESAQVLADLTKANLTRTRLILGVPESDIEFTRSLAGRVVGKVNIIEQPESGSLGAGHGPIGGESAFEEGRASAFWIDLPELEKERAPETLFHETSHLKDWELAQEWIRKYTAETKRPFVKSATDPLRKWLNIQAKKGRLTKADAEMVIMEAGDASAYTEARANVRSFLTDLQAGTPDLATAALVGYAHALKPKSQGGGGHYGNPAEGSEVTAALVAELKAAYREMSKTMKDQYDAAVAAAKKENPSAWISELDFSKRAGR